MLLRLTLLCYCVFSFANIGHAESLLKKGDRLAICGDSITQQLRYSKFIATYLAACHPQLDIDVATFGWSGDTSLGFSRRLETSVNWFAPSIATTCYGMNDGRYSALTDKNAETYRKGLHDIVDRFVKINCRSLVGTPGVVDSHTFRRISPDLYNSTLASLGAIAGKIADDKNQHFINLHAIMIEAMSKAKAALGDKYAVAGNDGVHPGSNGHLIMAYAFLKGLKVNGDLARIEMRADGTCTVSDGHSLIESKAGSATIKSSRYPYRINDKSITSILPFVPFMKELNRFTLVMPDCPWEHATITWGERSRSVSREELIAGINLASFEKTPFDEAFHKVMTAVHTQQQLEIYLVKSVLNSRPPQVVTKDENLSAAFASFVESLVSRRNELQQSVVSSVQAITHTISISEATAPTQQ